MGKATTSASALETGWAALRDGRWADARSSFETAPESPEAFEGLSWAAWWLDDAEQVFTAREQAYRLYKDRGDTASAARMATWLASDELDFHGAWAVASGWLQRAHRLLDPLEPGPDHGWLAFHEGYIAHMEGDTAATVEHAASAAEVGRTFGVPDLEMLGLALEGAALVASAEVERGMRLLDEATAAALEGDATIPISSAWACCFLVTACTSVLDYARASEWCERIADFAERYGSRYMLAFCRSEYGAIHLWRGEWGDAERMLEAAHEDYARSRPGWSSGPLAGLAELRRRQGRLAEAVELLERAGTSSSAQLCRARIALDRGDALAAIELVERVLRQSSGERMARRFPAYELLVRARVAQGDLPEADAALAELRALERALEAPSLEASVAFAAGIVAAAHGDHEVARPYFEDAVDRFRAAGAPFETALARTELAATLLVLDRAEPAATEAGMARETFRALGAEPAKAPRRVEAPVTPREREVLGLLAEGLTNRQIADRLGVSEHTVHRHVTNILRKLELPSRAAAAAYAVRSGLVAE